MGQQNLHIINLSTGLEFLPRIHADAFSRFQSSHLESKAWQKYLNSADNYFLYLLATGHHITLYDCGSRRWDGCPRTIWQGIPFLTHMLRRCWRLPIEKTLVKDMNVTDYFDDLYDRLDRRTIRYYRRYVTTDAIRLTGVYKRSLLDGRVAA